MSLSLLNLNRPTVRTRAITPLARLTSRLAPKLAGMQRRQAEKRIELAVIELDHPGVIADFQRAMRN